MKHSGTILEYGNGKIQTQQGRVGEHRCLVITKHDKARPVNSTPKRWSKGTTIDKVDALIIFKTIESARVLQDELNELIALWSKEQSQIVT